MARLERPKTRARLDLEKFRLVTSLVNTSLARQLHTERMEGLYTNIKPTQINICFPYVSLRQINVTLQNTYA